MLAVARRDSCFGMSYAHTKLWAGCKGGLDGVGRGGLYGTDNADHAEAVTLQHGDFKDCVVPTWRISDKVPAGPAIPADAKWKFSG